MKKLILGIVILLCSHFAFTQTDFFLTGGLSREFRPVQHATDISSGMLTLQLEVNGVVEMGVRKEFLRQNWDRENHECWDCNKYSLLFFNEALVDFVHFNMATGNNKRLFVTFGVENILVTPDQFKLGGGLMLKILDDRVAIAARYWVNTYENLINRMHFLKATAVWRFKLK